MITKFMDKLIENVDLIGATAATTVALLTLIKVITPVVFGIQSAMLILFGTCLIKFIFSEDKNNLLLSGYGMGASLLILAIA